MEPQLHKPSDAAVSSSQPKIERRYGDATGWRIALAYAGMLLTIVIGYSSAMDRGIRTGKVYGTDGLDLVCKCLVFGAFACGLLGLTAFLTRSRDTLWLYYTIAIVLSLLAIFIDDWKPLLQFRQWP